MKTKTSFNIIFPVIGILVFVWCVRNSDTVIVIAQKQPILAPLLVILWRIIGIVIPPIPGGIVSLALIPVFGWFLSFVYATVGVLIGTTIAFFLARKYGKKIVGQFVPLNRLDEWEKKFSKNQKFAAFLLIRFTTGPVLDFVSYVAGVSKISYWTFISATAISLLPDALYYYLGESIYRRASPWLFVLVLLGVIGYYFTQKTSVAEKIESEGIKSSIHSTKKRVLTRLAKKSSRARKV